MRIRAFAAASGLVLYVSAAGCFVYGEDLLGAGGAGGSGGASTTTTSTTSAGGTTTTTTEATPCKAPADCPAPASACTKALCTGGFCATENLPANTEIDDPTPGDCHAIVCDSAGGSIEVESSKDIPDDGKFCTVDACELGMPKHTPKIGYSCIQNGGKHCNDKGDCVECATDANCASQVCKDYACAPAGCNDGAKNGSETDTDCGGACQDCATGKACKVNTDCKSNICTSLICQPSCTDGAKNQAETDIDCGGPCGPCADNLGCSLATDCKSGVCKTNKCAPPTCMDGKKNGDESGVDCGGATCGTCPLNHLVINEVDYDQVGVAAGEFVEIFNSTAAGISLVGHKLILIDGVSNAPYDFVDLSPAGTLGPGQYLVVCDAPVIPAAGALKLTFASDMNRLQNGLSGGTGSPDGVALIDDTNDKLVDAVSYEGGITTANLSMWGLGVVSLVEGVALNSSVKDEAGGALCRHPNGKDTESSAADWLICGTPTPGASNVQ